MILKTFSCRLPCIKATFCKIEVIPFLCTRSEAPPDDLATIRRSERQRRGWPKPSHGLTSSGAQIELGRRRTGRRKKADAPRGGGSPGRPSAKAQLLGRSRQGEEPGRGRRAETQKERGKENGLAGFHLRPSTPARRPNPREEGESAGRGRERESGVAHGQDG